MPTIPPADLNREIDNLVAELLSPQPKDTQLDTTLITVDVGKLNQVKESRRLSPEQLAASGATIRRIELENKIDGYIFTIQHIYLSVTKARDLPEYLVKSGTDQAYIIRFYENLETTDEKVLAFAEQIDGTSVATAKQWQAAWDTAKDEETLDAQAKKLVRASLDFRAYLIGCLRYLGYSMSEIEGVSG
jgi:hypothetical protein